MGSEDLPEAELDLDSKSSWDKIDDDDDDIDPGDGKNKRYEKIQFLGEGQYATVWKARDTQSKDKIVAVKKINQGTKEEIRDGINRTAIREIKFMRELCHENVLGLLDVYGGKYNMNLVFEFMETDLEQIIREPDIIISAADIKRYLIMTLSGLEYLHDRWLLHRDLKPNNLLIDPNGVLKIADFGLARFYGSPSKQMTSDVVTRWYRPPELLLGARQYGTGIDIWSVGCILAELLLRCPLFPGDSDVDQLSRIFSVMGTPTDVNWPNHQTLRFFMQFKYMPKVSLDGVLPMAHEDLIEVADSMLVLNPLGRTTCAQALQMSFFSNYPPPTCCSKLPKKPSSPSRQGGLKRKASLLEDSSVCKALVF